MNFRDDTIETLNMYDYSLSDIEWISNGNVCYDIKEFFQVADFDYDCGYGTVEISEDLVIMMNDGRWFERSEYDGSEWWSIHYKPQKPNSVKESITEQDLRTEWWKVLNEQCENENQ